MRVLMLGWEFPPHISGGLGTACRGLTDAMGRMETRVLFILPKATEVPACEGDDEEEEARAVGACFPDAAARKSGELVTAPASSEVIDPYSASSTRLEEPSGAGNRANPGREQPRSPGHGPVSRSRHSTVRVMGTGTDDGYEGDLSRKIYDYAGRCVDLSRRELFDVIHAHDWLTFPAAMAIAEFSGRPLVVHVHATEFDRAGENINPAIYDFERLGMHTATRIIAVSERTKQTIVQRYRVPAEKVSVVYNGIQWDARHQPPAHRGEPEKVVLFLGRITMQKGPEYFVRAAAGVAERMNNVRFVMAGTGDQLPYIRGLVSQLGLDGRVEFTGFLQGSEVDRAYQRADVYVMPSVSEPFGLTALEAARHGVPIVLSKSSGAAEVLRRGALKVDFWDVDLMARTIVAVLQYPRLADTLRRASGEEILALSWDEAARKCIRFYYDSVS